MLNKIKSFLIIFALSALAALALYVAYLHRQGNAPAMTFLLENLKSQDMVFLVTRKMTVSAVLEKRNSDLFLGAREGIIWGKSEIVYGFDLQKISDSDISERGKGEYAVFLPEPEILLVAVDLPSLRFFTKQSMLSLAFDKISDKDLRNELQNEFAQASVKTAQDHKMFPGRLQMIETLNKFAGPLLEKNGIKVRFEYKK